MRVTLFDHGAGNLHSLAKAIAACGAEPELVDDPHVLADARVVVLPGVGAFGAAAAKLAPGRGVLARALRDGLPCLGICLGMQLLFDSSEEGAGEGLGVIPGRVTRLSADRVPHLGWNEVAGQDPLLERSGLTTAYHAHGYACRPIEAAVVSAWTRHDHDRFPAIVRAARTVGAQFHPEKSSQRGLAFVRAFLEEAACA